VGFGGHGGKAKKGKKQRVGAGERHSFLGFRVYFLAFLHGLTHLSPSFSSREENPGNFGGKTFVSYC
jgi:hypothetical protein